MTFSELKSHFGSIEKTRVALGYKSRQAIYRWGKDGIPEPQQFRIEALTEGALRADRRQESAAA